jgi:hypothetical protein
MMKLTNSKKIALLAALGALCFTAAAQAQTITYIGSQLDVGASWRDATLVKTFSNTGGAYGGDGYFNTAGPIVSSLPTYVSSASVGVQTFSGGGYEAIDNPTATPPYFSGTAASGTAYVNGAAAGSTSNMLTFTLAGTVPNTVQVGVMFDNTDNSNGLGNNAYTLVETTGGTATSSQISLTTGNGLADFYFFDIKNASAGEVFTLQDTNTSATNGSNLQAGALTFDTVAAPEPAPIAMSALAFGLLAFLLRRRAALAKI